MNYKALFFSLSALYLGQLHAESSEDELAFSLRPNFLHRSEALAPENFQDATDSYLEGYIQALLDIQFYEQRVIVTVKDHVVSLSNMPQNPALHESIKSYVADIPIQGISEVQVKELSSEEKTTRATYVEEPKIQGTWFPQTTVLFTPILADPREPVYSANYRHGDKAINRDAAGNAVAGGSAAAVSYGDDFPIFRWKDVGKYQGDLQFGITAGVFAVFSYERHQAKDMCELVNADYMIGGKLDYAVENVALRGRIYHISSHLGDEFLVNDPSFISKRVNPSFEAVDIFGSWQISDAIRGYAGVGGIFHSDDSFPMKYLYVEYGVEVRNFGWKSRTHQLYGSPFFAFNISNWQVRDFGFDFTAKLGYEWSKLQGVGRKMRLVATYHKGYSAEGQFFKEKTEFYELGASWGF